MWWVPWRASQVLSLPSKNIPGETQWELQRPRLECVGCPGIASLCTLPTGPRAGDYTYREGLEHKCKRDVLLGRLRSSEDQIWKRIRPRPTKTSFVGSYYLCKGEWTIAGLVPARSSSFQAYSRMATGEDEGAQIKPGTHLSVSLSSLDLVQRQRSLRVSCGTGAM